MDELAGSIRRGDKASEDEKDLGKKVDVGDGRVGEGGYSGLQRLARSFYNSRVSPHPTKHDRATNSRP